MIWHKVPIIQPLISSQDSAMLFCVMLQSLFIRAVIHMSLLTAAGAHK
jgi:hypothetical protein